MDPWTSDTAKKGGGDQGASSSWGGDPYSNNDPYANKGSTDPYGNGNNNFNENNSQFPDTGNTFGEFNENSEFSENKVTEIKPKFNINGNCAATGVVAFIYGGALGGALGGLQTAVEGFGAGLHNQPSSFSAHVLRGAGANAISFGGWLSAYSLVKCQLKVTRGTEDALNSFGAGMAAGMIGSLRTRNPMMIGASGLASGTFMAVLDSISPPKPVPVPIIKN